MASFKTIFNDKFTVNDNGTFVELVDGTIDVDAWILEYVDNSGFTHEFYLDDTDGIEIKSDNSDLFGKVSTDNDSGYYYILHSILEQNNVSLSKIFQFQQFSSIITDPNIYIYNVEMDVLLTKYVGLRGNIFHSGGNDNGLDIKHTATNTLVFYYNNVELSNISIHLNDGNEMAIDISDDGSSSITVTPTDGNVSLEYKRIKIYVDVIFPDGYEYPDGCGESDDEDCQDTIKIGSFGVNQMGHGHGDDNVVIYFVKINGNQLYIPSIDFDIEDITYQLGGELGEMVTTGKTSTPCLVADSYPDNLLLTDIPFIVDLSYLTLSGFTSSDNFTLTDSVYYRDEDDTLAQGYPMLNSGGTSLTVAEMVSYIGNGNYIKLIRESVTDNVILVESFNDLNHVKNDLNSNVFFNNENDSDRYTLQLQSGSSISFFDDTTYTPSSYPDELTTYTNSGKTYHLSEGIGGRISSTDYQYGDIIGDYLWIDNYDSLTSPKQYFDTKTFLWNNDSLPEDSKENFVLINQVNNLRKIYENGEWIDKGTSLFKENGITTVKSLSKLRELDNVKKGDVIYTKGYRRLGDVGCTVFNQYTGNNFYLCLNDSGTVELDNGGTNIVSDNNQYQYKLLKDISDLTLDDFGGIPMEDDSVFGEEYDNSPFIQNMLDNDYKVKIPVGFYYLYNTTVLYREYNFIEGTGFDSTFLYTNRPINMFTIRHVKQTIKFFTAHYNGSGITSECAVVKAGDSQLYNNARTRISDGYFNYNLLCERKYNQSRMETTPYPYNYDYVTNYNPNFDFESSGVTSGRSDNHQGGGAHHFWVDYTNPLEHQGSYFHQTTVIGYAKYCHTGVKITRAEGSYQSCNTGTIIISVWGYKCLMYINTLSTSYLKIEAQSQDSLDWDPTDPYTVDITKEEGMQPFIKMNGSQNTYDIVSYDVAGGSIESPGRSGQHKIPGKLVGSSNSFIGRSVKVSPTGPNTVFFAKIGLDECYFSNYTLVNNINGVYFDGFPSRYDGTNSLDMSRGNSLMSAFTRYDVNMGMYKASGVSYFDDDTKYGSSENVVGIDVEHASTWSTNNGIDNYENFFDIKDNGGTARYPDDENIFFEMHVDFNENKYVDMIVLQSNLNNMDRLQMFLLDDSDELVETIMDVDLGVDETPNNFSEYIGKDLINVSAQKLLIRITRLDNGVGAYGLGFDYMYLRTTLVEETDVNLFFDQDIPGIKNLTNGLKIANRNLMPFTPVAEPTTVAELVEILKYVGIIYSYPDLYPSTNAASVADINATGTWSSTGSPNIEVIDTGSYHGTYHLKFSTDTYGGTVRSGFNFTHQSGYTYKAQFYGKVTDNTQNQNIHLWGNSFNSVSVSSTGWTYYELEFTATTDDSITLYVYVDNGSNTGPADIFIDKMEVLEISP